MIEDEKKLLLSFIGYWIVLAILIFKSDRKIRTGLINLLFHLAYSLYFLHGLFYKSQGGMALAWFLYLLFMIWTHTAINLGQIIFQLIKTSRK